MLRNRARKGSKNQGSDYNSRTEKDDSQILCDWNRWISEDRSQQAEGCAAGAEREVDSLSRASRNADEPGQYRRDNHVDRDQDDISSRNRTVQDPKFRAHEAVPSHPKEYERVNEGN